MKLRAASWLDQFDYNYKQMRASGYAWPVIESHVRYAHGILFEQKIRVRAILKEWENRLKIEYQIFDAESGKRLAKAIPHKWRSILPVGKCVFSRRKFYCSV